MLIRPETAADAGAIRRVNERAFGGAAEAELVERLRARGGVVLSLVAVEDDQVVGHVLFTPVALEAGEEGWSVVALGPVAVLPGRQRRGIGAALIEAGLAACREAGHAAVFVLGHPEYYPRFGFVPASRFGFRGEFAVPDPVFMALELHPGALAGRGGLVRYAPEFHAV